VSYLSRGTAFSPWTPGGQRITLAGKRREKKEVKMAKIILKYNKEKGKNAILRVEISFSPEELKLNPIFKEIPVSRRDGIIIEKPDYRGNRQYDSIKIEAESIQDFIFIFQEIPEKEDIEKLIKIIEDEIRRALEEAKKKQEIVEKWEREVIL
jgi:hypothetical protein